jgi:hypothetical protein
LRRRINRKRKILWDYELEEAKIKAISKKA